MPRNQRYVLPGYAYHVTQRGTDGQNVFRQAGDRKVYLDLMQTQRPDCRTRVLAYALMTNHVHWILVPEHGDSLAVLFRRVHGRYAQYFNSRYSRSGHLWQGRFYSCPLSPAHLDVALKYVERNPVRAGMVVNPQAYRWSSAQAHCTKLGGNDDLLDAEFWQSRGGAEAWRAMLGSPTSDGLTYLLRRCTHAERPFGPESFIAEIEAKLGRKWKRWTYERELVDTLVQMSIERPMPAVVAAGT